MHMPFPSHNDPAFAVLTQGQTNDEPPHQTASQTPSQVQYVRFIDSLRFLRLQSEICSVNIGMRAIQKPQSTHEHWLIDVERRIFEIKASAATNKKCALMEHHTILILHMPCARNPSPEDSSVLKYFDAAVQTAKGHWDLIESNDLDHPWHASHHCYEAGILILYGLCHHRTLIQRHYTMAQVFEVVHQISGIFVSPAQGPVKAVVADPGRFFSSNIGLQLSSVECFLTDYEKGR